MSSYMNCLGFSMKKSLSSIDFVEYFATNGNTSFRERSILNKSLCSRVSIFWIFMTSVTLVSNSALICLYSLQFIKKCISSSTVLQKGQILALLSKPLCLSFSIISLWLDNGNFVVEIRSFIFLTERRYGSSPISHLIIPYVLSLLSAFGKGFLVKNVRIPFICKFLVVFFVSS